MKPLIVILNGPPACGKDTHGNLLLANTKGVYLSTFKHDLILTTARTFKVSLDWLKNVCNDRDTKEVPQEKLRGKSPREALIYVSEILCKPLYGEDYFGIKAEERISDMKDCVIVFTDGGFKEEVQVFVDRGYNVCIAQLHGRGTFEGDSRDYIDIKSFSCNTIKLDLVEGNPTPTVKTLEDLVHRYFIYLADQKEKL